MPRPRAFARVALPVATLAFLTTGLTGCIIVDTDKPSNYQGYGSVQKAELDAIVAANTQNRIGDPIDTVLARYPAEQLSLVHSQATASGGERAVYRVYARESSRSTTFERYLVFENGRLSLLTDDRDEVPQIERHD